MLLGVCDITLPSFTGFKNQKKVLNRTSKESDLRKNGSTEMMLKANIFAFPLFLPRSTANRSCPAPL
jgi:hypothetical protein